MSRSSRKTLNVESPSFTPASLQQQYPQQQKKQATAKEFTPQPHQNYELCATNGTSADAAGHYDPFNMCTVGHSLPTAASYNPYAAADQGGLTAHSAAFFQGQNAFPAHHQPVSVRRERVFLGVEKRFDTNNAYTWAAQLPSVLSCRSAPSRSGTVPPGDARLLPAGEDARGHAEESTSRPPDHAQ